GTGQPPVDPADFVAHFTVTGDVTPAAPVPTAPVVTPVGVTDTTEPNPCFQYSGPVLTTFGVTATWVSPTRLQFKPLTPDGYWPTAAPNAEYLRHFDTLGDPVIVHGRTP